ncbi:hypothetical protein DSL72_002158 [Monilinia vaccinii-corymbosi]|uniref:SMP-30/Gluconolactonase/LRE-like region domain-containing protein n=1 Tax=Monilinia vaccinii-corymbosi TaxID=61207 RepID=A0A8A3PBU1_9HELO|nr:hypothetical protein DSL72_002158 [Monilinia vaccinii-corymbosi]
MIDSLGYTRVLEPFQNFDVECQKVDDAGLEGCADMWLHPESGMLYMACSDARGRAEWFPSLNLLNASGRSSSDRIGVLDTRGSGPIKNRLTWLQVETPQGGNYDGTFNIHGFSIMVDRSNKKRLHIALINDRPYKDTGEVWPPQIEWSTTIEYFATTLGSNIMTHKKTLDQPKIITPRRVLWLGEHLLVFTNAHRSKSRTGGYLDFLLGGGSIGYCTLPKGNCGTMKTDGNLRVPSGIALGHDSLIYVASSVSGQINVFSSDEHHLIKVDTIQVPHPISSISIDDNGDIYATTIPVLHEAMKNSQDPKAHIASAVFRIMKLGEMVEGETGWGWSVVKMMEDDGKILPTTTIAVHDKKSGKMFLGGALDPFISICEKKGGGSFTAPLNMLNL